MSASVEQRATEQDSSRVKKAVGAVHKAVWGWPGGWVVTRVCGSILLVLAGYQMAGR